ncbi:MAG: M1 family aminopeptidase [Bacteroidales bacterium]|jgi:aminopeptidase N|nr:aminopeptidase [Bacteroidales bacterium]
MRKFTIIPLILTFLGCSGPEPGVSLQLARERKEAISGLGYELFFNLPEDPKAPIRATQTIRFNLETPRQIILDFKEDPAFVTLVQVNGRTAQYRFTNEHIVLPRRYFNKDNNIIAVDFRAGEQSLNRNEEFLYTLLVPDRARTLFPCFDQPNLKAAYTLTLEVPDHWVAVSNTAPNETFLENKRKTIRFGTTEPLSTYLFSFVAGEFQQETQTRNGRSISLYHRETDPLKIAQTGIIFDQVYASLEWLEEYTGIPYPFAKYDFIILPGFQYGGMEHTGATLYNDRRMFLGEHPTTGEQLSRMSLIAHETAHMWFGDYVTMDWFDDVWTKEVFANYFASQMIRPQFPGINHRLNDLRAFYATAYAVDRTAGTNAIKQPLDNLAKAGLIYGNIIYDKAPVVMNMLVERMGPEAFRKGIRTYLKQFAYGNATWEDLISILDRETSEDLESWSRVWIHSRGMPHIHARISNDSLVVTQTDPLGRDLLWPQKVTFLLTTGEQDPDLNLGRDQDLKLDREQNRTLTLELELAEAKAPVPPGMKYILPNTDGLAYGMFLPDSLSMEYMLHNLARFEAEETRLSLLMTLYENMLAGNLSGDAFTQALIRYLPAETNNLVRNSALSYLADATLRYTTGENVRTEAFLLETAANTKEDKEYRLLTYRTLTGLFTDSLITKRLFEQWDNGKSFDELPFAETEMTSLAYQLMIRLPEKASYICEKQLERITNPDRRKAFAFITQAVNPDPAARDAFFQSLLEVENRSTEPWVISALGYLNHFLRQEHALKYIHPALAGLEEVQQTGDIFFPTAWISACLGGHNSRAAADIVSAFLREHPDYEPLLKNKILQAADNLRDSVSLSP